MEGVGRRNLREGFSEMSIYTESVWDTVRQHSWKWRPRTKRITGILWHSTRGNQGYDGNTELNAFCNWVRSPNNRVAGMPSVGIEPYAGISSVGIGPGRIVEVVPDFAIPAWSSWQSDERKLSVEVAQSNLGQPIEPETIAACVQYARAMADIYQFPLTRVFPTNDDTWVGMAGHEDTLQGKASGKSDPGEAFWTPFLAALNEEESMTPEERAKLDAVYAALSGGLPNVVEDWNKNGNSLLLGFANEQGRLSDHIATHGGGSGIPEHKHEAGKVIR